MPTLEMSSNYQTKPSPHHSSTHHHSSSSTQKQFYLLTNVSTTKTSATDTEIIDLHAESWKLPYSIDDSELTFDGKPLNLLYEENRCHVTLEAREHKSRGRSRKCRK